MIDWNERHMVCDSCGTINDMPWNCWSVGKCTCWKCGHLEEFESKNTRDKRLEEEKKEENEFLGIHGSD